MTSSSCSSRPGRDILAMPNRETLRKLVALLELGMFRISVEEVLPLERASARLDALANRRAKGKIVVSIER
jgi:NADPH:quinone reductase-like Zn-dependent oxidoreductase